MCRGNALGGVHSEILISCSRAPVRALILAWRPPPSLGSEARLEL